MTSGISFSARILRCSLNKHGYTHIRVDAQTQKIHKYRGTTVWVSVEDHSLENEQMLHDAK